MKNKSLTLTLVIPVYNEEDHIKECLEAVACQTVMPDEVLVIDNNCTDKTITIARQFTFVRIIHEKTQGLIAARNHGFDEAKGDILGRIDADSRIQKDWVARVKHDFNVPLDGVTGLAIADTLPLKGNFQTVFWSHFYFWWREATFGHFILWGANMAISREAWQKIKNKVCLDDSKVHEDQDISSLIVRYGGRLKCDTKLIISTDAHDYNYWPKFYEYSQRARKTKQMHYQDLHSKNAQSIRLNLLQRGWRMLLIIVPYSIFIGVSLLLYSFQLLKGKRR